MTVARLQADIALGGKQRTRIRDELGVEGVALSESSVLDVQT